MSSPTASTPRWSKPTRLKKRCKSMLASWLSAYQTLLSPARDPIRAAGMAAYMKNHFTFIGIPTPSRRKLVRHLELQAKKDLNAEQIMGLANLLYQQAEREYHYCAIDLLACCHSKLTAAELPQLESLIVTHSWWDSVDTLASKIVGPLVQREPDLMTRMDELVCADNMWLRRTAILYQLGAKSATDEARLFHACLANAGDSDFFIRKAIGWALRQYARIAPEVVRQFVAQHQLSPLSQREALKHL
ncbi:DNA alkylation repair protein [Chitinibacter sp. S2-10]|uniref:DNA alkylation repair protein n=1 Tax=Chitinibacter sp. S2-10 TaxID=3373597 RepID=UPI003977AC6C